MTEQETIKVIALIVMSYPASERFKDESAVKGMVAVWKQMFQDDDVKIVELAVQKHIATNKWAPSVAEIRETVAELTNQDLIPPDRAWEIFDDFWSESVWDWDTEKLPPLISSVVSRLGSRDHFYKFDVYRRFMELYKPAYERAKMQASLPRSVLNGILSIQGAGERLMLEEKP